MRSTLYITVLAYLSFPVLAAETWPMRFVWEHGEEHIFVVLYSDGKAAYSSRHSRSNKSQMYFVASQARWSNCDGSKANDRPQCISVHVQGYSSLRDGEFRFDYSLDGDTLTQMEKDGPAVVLKRYCDPGEAACTSNPSLERTRER
jgi:hypothetical protein